MHYMPAKILISAHAGNDHYIVFFQQIPASKGSGEGSSGHGKRKEKLPNQHYREFWRHYNEDNEWVEERKAARELMAGSMMPDVCGLFHIR